MEKSQDPVVGDSPEESHTTSTYVKPQYRPPHDSTIKFEEYFHYAQKTRVKEEAIEAPSSNWREWFSRKKHSAGTESSGGVTAPEESFPSTYSTDKGTGDAEGPRGLVITDQEWENASRSLRTASAGAC